MRSRLLLVVCLGLLFLSPAEACSVPVFAYALRRWEPEAHTCTTARDEAWRQALTQECEAAALNLTIEAGDGQDRLNHRTMAGPWWTGALDDQRRTSLLASPLRQELARRLASGETAVWLFIPGGNATADAVARTLLAERLAYLRKVTELPPAETDDDTASEVLAMPGPAVRLAFSVLEVRRDDPTEWVLASQIRAMAKDRPGPWAVPVYGRARALGILHGATFSTTAIDDTVEFLTAACSCQVKDLNPGCDLLVACNWPEALNAAGDVPAVVRKAPSVPETVVITPDADVPRPVVDSPVISCSTQVGIAVALLLCFGLVMGTLRSRRRSAAARSASPRPIQKS